MQTGNNLVVVDVQPDCANECGPLMPKYIAEVTRRIDYGEDVYLTVNDLEHSGDTDEDVADFWCQHGLDEAYYGQLIHVPKTYAFLRGWMDNRVPDSEIVKTLRALRKAGLDDTRFVELKELEKLAPRGSWLVDPLYLPEVLEYSELAHLESVDICGGYRDRCLREVEIWLDSRGTKYQRLEHLVFN